MFNGRAFYLLPVAQLVRCGGESGAQVLDDQGFYSQYRL